MSSIAKISKNQPKVEPIFIKSLKFVKSRPNVITIDPRKGMNIPRITIARIVNKSIFLLMQVDDRKDVIKSCFYSQLSHFDQ